MLTSFRKGAAALATIAALFATSAQAETHEILIMELAYFPETTFVKAGDKIVFKNDSSLPHTVVSSDNSWTLALIPQGGEAEIMVSNTMATAFSGVAWQSATISGAIDFSAAPLQ